MNKLMDVIKNIRNLKVEMKVPNKRLNNLYAYNDGKINKYADYICRLCNVNQITFVNDRSEVVEKVSVIVSELGEFMVPLGDLIDFAKERERLEQEYAKAVNELNRAKGMLENPNFINKAPKNLIDKEKEKIKNFSELAEKIKEKINTFE